MELVLASASPRRLELLRQIGIEPSAIDPAHIDETAKPLELPHLYTRRIALAKLREVAQRHPGQFVLSADTSVICGRRILGKASDALAATKMLKLLSGRRHRVLGAIAIHAPGGKIRQRLITTIVTMKRLSDKEVEEYIAGQEWQDKAGAYAIQGRAASFIPSISGSYSNVVGLSLYDTQAMLQGLGFCA